jgi:alpha-D-ribose 1-methylphosphonate 5-triphosphate synthase subunit PhnH
VAGSVGYDEVRHGQLHFRSLLDSMSFPGRINALDPVDFTPPPTLARASALVAFALMNADVSFHLVNMRDEDAAFLALQTRARIAPVDEATFIFARGADTPDVLEGASCGTLTYPDTGATLVIQVDVLSGEPLSGGIKLTLTGPGVNGSATVYLRPMNPDFLLALQARNVEFPLGIDTIVTCDEAASGSALVLGIPRTARLSWDAC